MDAVKVTIQFAKDADYVEHRAGYFQCLWYTNSCATSYQVCEIAIIFNNHI